jgi:hypothetical protein
MAARDRGGAGPPERERPAGPAPFLQQPRLAALARLRRQRNAQRLHELGPRAVFELLDEIARHHEIESDIDFRLGRYAAINPQLLRRAGGDRFPAPPTRLVEGRR